MAVNYIANLLLRVPSDENGLAWPPKEARVYDAPEVNAFATGVRRNSALVVVSTCMKRLFMSHPPLVERIRVLQRNASAGQRDSVVERG